MLCVYTAGKVVRKKSMIRTYSELIKLKTFEEFYGGEPETEAEAIDDYADSLNSNVTIDIQSTLSGLFDKYGEDVVVDALKRLYL